jgi:hypothetical protein
MQLHLAINLRAYAQDLVRRTENGAVKSLVAVELPTTFDSLWPAIEDLAAR